MVSRGGVCGAASAGGGVAAGKLDLLTLDQIGFSLAVADTGSFSKAAKRLNPAPSTMTHGIQKLEAQFDIPLFDRHHLSALADRGGA